MCISHFGNRSMGTKDPLASRRRFNQSFPNKMRPQLIFAAADACILLSAHGHAALSGVPLRLEHFGSDPLRQTVKAL